MMIQHSLRRALRALMPVLALLLPLTSCGGGSSDGSGSSSLTNLMPGEQFLPAGYTQATLKIEGIIDQKTVKLTLECTATSDGTAASTSGNVISQGTSYYEKAGTTTTNIPFSAKWDAGIVENNMINSFTITSVQMSNETTIKKVGLDKLNILITTKMPGNSNDITLVGHAISGTLTVQRAGSPQMEEHSLSPVHSVVLTYKAVTP